jgi:hypothetical protein
LSPTAFFAVFFKSRIEIKEDVMCYFDHFKQTDDEALINAKINLDVLQRALDARISQSAVRTEAAFKQALQSTDQHVLASIDQQIDLLQSMRVDAECLKNLGCTDSYVRLDRILDDFNSMRATLAKTLALLLSSSLPLEPAIAVKVNLQCAFLGRLIEQLNVDGFAVGGGRIHRKTHKEILA